MDDRNIAVSLICGFALCCLLLIINQYKIQKCRLLGGQ